MNGNMEFRESKATFFSSREQKMRFSEKHSFMKAPARFSRSGGSGKQKNPRKIVAKIPVDSRSRFFDDFWRFSGPSGGPKTKKIRSRTRSKNRMVFGTKKTRVREFPGTGGGMSAADWRICGALVKRGLEHQKHGRGSVSSKVADSRKNTLPEDYKPEVYCVLSSANRKFAEPKCESTKEDFLRWKAVRGFGTPIS